VETRHRILEPSTGWIRAHPGPRSGFVSQETSDFCGKDGIAAEIETIPINQVKDAFEGVICRDMRLATWRRSSGGETAFGWASTGCRNHLIAMG